MLKKFDNDIEELISDAENGRKRNTWNRADSQCKYQWIYFYLKVIVKRINKNIVIEKPYNEFNSNAFIYFLICILVLGKQVFSIFSFKIRR